MSLTATSLNPSLLAILLVAQGTAGSNAQVVFHYPPEPLSTDRSYEDLSATDEEDDGSSNSDSEDSSSEEDLHLFASRVTNGLTLSSDHRAEHSDNEDDHFHQKKVAQDGVDWKPSWDPLLGLGEDGLVGLLAPGRVWHKRKFELGINDLTFLGRPVYARDDGSWRKPKSKKYKHPPEEEPSPSSDAPGENAHTRGNNNDNDGSEGEEAASSGTATPSKHRKQLTMFHVVFVMNPPPLEQTFRVKEMYDHVVKKFSKALKWEQSHNNYVWEQSELLLSIKNAHLHQRSPTKAVYSEMLGRSSLATAVARVFDNISASKIAAIKLSAKVSISLQIPPVTSTSYLPSLNEPPLEPGLWLTTATDQASTESELDSGGNAASLQLSKNFTLLLKASPQKIIKDVQAAGGPLAGPLATFVAKATPTKSFYKISISSQISLGDIQQLARHLIYWRRAVAINPLHQRDTYIVSPNAPMAKLVAACKAYESAFPMMPSLPKMLKDLSGVPAPYGTLIPSSDHKEEYYRVLAWLMREGWITQLRTFAFVRVGPDVKKAVREQDRDHIKGIRPPREREAISTTPGDRDAAKSLGTSATSSTINTTFQSANHLKRPSMVSRPSSEGKQSVSTDQTSRVSQGPTHNPKAASLILSTLRASPEESKWLDYIASTLQTPNHSPHTQERFAPKDVSMSPASDWSIDEETYELRKYWPVFEKYFNGSEVIERIPVREGLKRAFVWNLLRKMGLDFESGVEDERSQQRRLVTIRHW